jgi:hypothetical protein
MPAAPGPTDLVVGPLSYGGLLSFADPANRPGVQADGSYFYKSGAQLTPGATVTVTIAPAASAYASVLTEYGAPQGYRQVIFRACPGGKHGTWWVGGFVLRDRRAACLPLDIASGSSPTVRRVVVSLGRGHCP